VFENVEHNDEEKSFSDAYRSEILDKGEVKKDSIFPKLISILLLIILISAISIFGYKYFNNSTSITTHLPKNVVEESVVEKSIIKKEDRKEYQEKDIQEVSLPKESMMIDNIDEIEILETAPEDVVKPLPTTKKNDIDQIANQMKLELAKELDKSGDFTPEEKIKTAPSSPQIQKGEDIYMKQLEELSHEINGGGN